MLKQLQEKTGILAPQTAAKRLIIFILRQSWDKLYYVGTDLVAEDGNYSKKDRRRYICEYPLLRNELSCSTELWHNIEAAFEGIKFRKLEYWVARIYDQLPARKETLVETEDCTPGHIYNSLIKGLNGMRLTIEDRLSLDRPVIRIYRRKRKNG